jgi:DNA-binding CsgD family transcriptional regulator
LAAVDALLGRVAGGGSSFIVIIGPAGIGKTRFLSAVEHRARNAGLEVLRADGAEFERGLAFGGAVQLFEAALHAVPGERRVELLAGVAGLGGELLGFGTGRLADRAGDHAFAVIHGLYWLCANLAASSPLALLVDDAHWLDEQSLAWIEYLARRRQGLAVLVVVATRPEEERGQRLVRAAIESAGEVLELRPLSADAVGELIDAGLGGPVEAEFVAAFQDATLGNPFLVHELLRTVRDEGLALDGTGARTLQTLGSDRIGRAVLVRLHRLSPAAVELARAIAVLGGCGSLGVAAKLAELDDPTAGRAVEGLVAANVLAKAGDLRFQHPVVQASVYQDLPERVRAVRHRQAARVLAEMGATVGEVASQLLEADPVGDPWSVEILRSAAADASALGAPRSTIMLLERALAELPASSSSEMLLALGRAALAVLDVPKALDALGRAMDRAGSAADRAVAALQLARALLHAGRAQDAIRLLARELRSGSDINADLRTWLEVEYALYTAPHAEAFATTQRFRVFAGGTVAQLAALAVASSMADTAREAAELAGRALAGGVLVRALDAQSVWFIAPWMLIRADRLDEATRIVEDALDHSRVAGSRLGFARSSWLRAELDYAQGDLLNAEAHARSAFAIAYDGGSLWVWLMSGALLAQVLADRGALADAHDIAAALDISLLAPSERLTRPVHYARAYVALLAGCPTQATREFEHLNEPVEVALAARSRFTTGMGLKAIGLSRLGRMEEARLAAAEEVAWAQRWGAPRFVGMALRARASTVDNTEGVEALQAAVALLERTPARLELARALGDLGSTLRRVNQRVAAREPLRRALDLARRCRADALADHLHGELTAAGAKPRRELLTGRDSLTASEGRIAAMAATGMTNPQIAQSLFLTPGTVEKHLTSIYSKLGISSRHQLRIALGTD